MMDNDNHICPYCKISFQDADDCKTKWNKNNVYKHKISYAKKRPLPSKTRKGGIISNYFKSKVKKPENQCIELTSPVLHTDNSELETETVEKTNYTDSNQSDDEMPNFLSPLTENESVNETEFKTCYGLLLTSKFNP